MNRGFRAGQRTYSSFKAGNNAFNSTFYKASQQASFANINNQM